MEIADLGGGVSIDPDRVLQHAQHDFVGVQFDQAAMGQRGVGRRWPTGKFIITGTFKAPKYSRSTRSTSLASPGSVTEKLPTTTPATESSTPASRSWESIRSTR